MNVLLIVARSMIGSRIFNGAVSRAHKVIATATRMIELNESSRKFRLCRRTMLTNSEGGKGKINAENFLVALIDEMEQPRHFKTIFTVDY